MLATWVSRGRQTIVLLMPSVSMSVGFCQTQAASSSSRMEWSDAMSGPMFILHISLMGLSINYAINVTPGSPHKYHNEVLGRWGYLPSMNIPT